MAEYACIADGDAVWADAGPGREELQGLIAPAAGGVPTTVSFMSIGCGRLYVLFQRDRERRGIVYCLSAQYPLRRAEAASLLSLMSALFWGWTPPAEGGTGSALLTPEELRASLQRALGDTLKPFEPRGGPLPPPVPPSVYPRVHFPKGVKQQVHDVLGEGEEEGGDGREGEEGEKEEEEEDEEREIAWEREEKRKRRAQLMRLMAKSSSQKPPPPSPLSDTAEAPPSAPEDHAPRATTAPPSKLPPSASSMKGANGFIHDDNHASPDSGIPSDADPAAEGTFGEAPAPVPDASGAPEEDEEEEEEPLLVDILMPHEEEQASGVPPVHREQQVQKEAVNEEEKEEGEGVGEDLAAAGEGGGPGDDGPLLVDLVEPLEGEQAIGVPGAAERGEEGEEGEEGAGVEEEGAADAAKAEPAAVPLAAGAAASAALVLGAAALVQASAAGEGEESFSHVPRGVLGVEGEDVSSASSVAGSLSSSACAEDKEQEERGRGPATGKVDPTAAAADWSAIKAAAIADAGTGAGPASLGTGQQQVPISMVTAVSLTEASRKEPGSALASASSYSLTPCEKKKAPKAPKGPSPSERKEHPPPPEAPVADQGQESQDAPALAAGQLSAIALSGDLAAPGGAPPGGFEASTGAEVPMPVSEPLISVPLAHQGHAVPSAPKGENGSKGVNKARRSFHLFSPRNAPPPNAAGSPGARHDPATPLADPARNTLSPATSLSSKGSDELKTEALALLARSSASSAPDAPGTPAVHQEQGVSPSDYSGENPPHKAGGAPAAFQKKFPDLTGMEADVASPGKGHVAAPEAAPSPSPSAAFHPPISWKLPRLKQGGGGRHPGSPPVHPGSPSSPGGAGAGSPGRTHFSPAAASPLQTGAGTGGQAQGTPAAAEHKVGAPSGGAHSGHGNHHGSHSHLGALGGLGRVFHGRRGVGGETAREQGQGAGKEGAGEREEVGAVGVGTPEGASSVASGGGEGEAEASPGVPAASPARGPYSLTSAGGDSSPASAAAEGEGETSGAAPGVPEAGGPSEEEQGLAEKDKGRERQRRGSFTFLRVGTRAHPKVAKGATAAGAGGGFDGAEGGAGAEEGAAGEGGEGGEEKAGAVGAVGAGEHEGGSSGGLWGAARGRRRGSLTILRTAAHSSESQEVLAQGQKERRSFVVARAEALGGLGAGGEEHGLEEGEEDEEEEEEEEDEEEEETKGSLGTPLGSSTPDSLAGSTSSKGAGKGEQPGKGLGGLFRKGGSALRMFDRKAAAR